MISPNNEEDHERAGSSHAPTLAVVVWFLDLINHEHGGVCFLLSFPHAWCSQLLFYLIMQPYVASPAGTRVNTVVLIFTLLAGLVVFLRLFTRMFLVRKAPAEDACISLAMLLSIGLTVTIAIQVQKGLGKHIYELTETEMVATLKAFWASIWMYNLSLTATKVSILIQYLRTFPTQRFRLVCSAMLAVVIIYGTWTLFSSIFLCLPVEFFWDKATPGGRCLNQYAVWFTNAGINILQDIVLLALPIWKIRSLSIPKAQKRALIVVFAFGGLVCLVSIVRLQSLLAISNSTDPTFDNTSAAVLSSVETNIGIICACLPSMRPLLSSMMPTYFADTSRYTNFRSIDEESKDMRAPTPINTLASNRIHRPTHSRTGSAKSVLRCGSELEEICPTRSASSKYSASVRSTESRYQKPHRHYPGSPSRLSPLTMSPWSPLAPALSRPGQIRHSFGIRSPRRTTRTPVFQKPLPITPFPVSTENTST